MPDEKSTKYFDEENRPQTRAQWIADRLLQTYLAMDRPSPKAPIVLTMAEDLCSELGDEQILRGLTRLRKEREWVTVKAILELSGGAAEDGRPGVEAAWAMCPKTEDQSVVWTDEMAVAFGACRSLLRDGDEIGARMVFKEQYSGLVSAARLAHVPVRWEPSLGFEPGDRVRALSEAVEKKRMHAAHAFRLLGVEGQAELLRALPPPERKLLVGDASSDSATELAAIRRRFGNRPTVEKETSSLDSNVLIHDLVKNDLVKNGLAKEMPEIQTPPPHRAVERTDGERAEHAKRVREQAAALRARVMHNKPAAGQEPQPCPDEVNIA
jgi:hypothetical protein